MSTFFSIKRLCRNFLAGALLLGPLLASGQFPGGFLEDPTRATPRAVLNPGQIKKMLPSRGKFTFPAPYNTEAVRLTNPSDCGGRDCVNAVGYSYWRNINNHVGQDTMLFFLSLDRRRGGAGPILFEYNKKTDAVRNLGPLLPEDHVLSWGSGEGWYFSGTIPTQMYMHYDSKILRYDVISRKTETVVDVAAHLGRGHHVWQLSSSDDDRVHAATIRNSANQSLGCMAFSENTGKFQFFRGKQRYDECQVDKSGRWLVIKEDVDGRNGLDNRVIDLSNGRERILKNLEGAAGHSDMGHGYMVGADDSTNHSNMQKIWNFTTSKITSEPVFYNDDWNVFAPNHISHTNARANVPAEKQYACGSSANHRNGRQANEIICFKLNGENEALIVAPVMTNLNARGGNVYDNSPKGNLDVTGRYFIWTSNMGSNRLDAFLVKVPSHLLGAAQQEIENIVPGHTDRPPAPGNVLTPGPNGDSQGNNGNSGDNRDKRAAVPVRWSGLVNTRISGSSLVKNSGCDGCADAGANSEQMIRSGDGYFEFAAQIQPNRLRLAGLSGNTTAISAAGVDFAVRLEGNKFEIREKGRYRYDGHFANGDIFRIAVQKGKISYSRNGKVFYTSSAAPAFPLRAKTVFYSTRGSIARGMINSTTAAQPAPSGNSSNGKDNNGQGSSSGPSPVSWTGHINTRVRGSELVKTDGCDGCADAGAHSVQQIRQGNGYFEFTAPVQRARLRLIGLGGNSGRNRPRDLDFAVRLQGNTFEIHERGQYRWDGRFRAGDVFRISVENGHIRYSRNGKVFYTSSASPSFPLRASTVFYSLNGSIANARLSSGS